MPIFQKDARSQFRFGVSFPLDDKTECYTRDWLRKLHTRKGDSRVGSFTALAVFSSDSVPPTKQLIEHPSQPQSTSLLNNLITSVRRAEASLSTKPTRSPTCKKARKNVRRQKSREARVDSPKFRHHERGYRKLGEKKHSRRVYEGRTRRTALRIQQRGGTNIANARREVRRSRRARR